MASAGTPADWDITGHPDGFAIWFEGEPVAVWKTLVCAGAARNLAHKAAESVPSMLAGIFNPIPADPSATDTAAYLQERFKGEQS